MSDTGTPHHLLTSDLSVPVFMSMLSDGHTCFGGFFCCFCNGGGCVSTGVHFTLFSFLFRSCIDLGFLWTFSIRQFCIGGERT